MDAPAIATSLPPAQVKQAWAAAQDFEAMALNQFLAPMFDTVDRRPVGSVADRPKPSGSRC